MLCFRVADHFHHLNQSGWLRWHSCACGHVLPWHCELCSRVHTSKIQGFSPWSFLYVNYERVQPLLGSRKTQVTLNCWDTQERILVLGLKLHLIPLAGISEQPGWVLRIFTLSTCGSAYIFYPSLNFFEVWLQVCDRHKSWVSLQDFRAGVNFKQSRCCARTKYSWGSCKPGGAWR